MTHTTPPLRTVLTLVAATCLAACSDSPPSNPGQKFVAGISSMVEQARPLAAGTVATAATSRAITNDQVFAWAQLTYPDLFSGTPFTFSGVAYQGKTFAGQGFANGNYLAVANGEAWGLGPFTGQVLQNFGAVQSYADLVCALVDCGRSGPTSTCTQPQGEALLAGNRLVATYVRTSTGPVVSTSEYTTTSVVDGPTTFNGQPAVLITRTTDPGGGAAPTQTLVYVQAGDGGLVRTLGTDTSVPGSGPTTRVIYDPPLNNSEFTLQAGQQLTKTASMSTSQLNPSLPATASTRSTTYTFEARETLSVQGRSYDTCRYREAAVGGGSTGTTWTIVGSGIPARIDTLDAATGISQRSELKAATVNGSAVSPGQATLDVASAERMVTEFSYLLPICSPTGIVAAAPHPASALLHKAVAMRQLSRVTVAAAPRERALAYTSTKPSDQLGSCGGRQTYPSYSHVNGVTTATMRWENYCSKDSDTGGTQVMNGSWSFVETATPGANGPIRTRYEANSANGISMVDKDAAGKTIGSQLITVIAYVSTPGVPDGSATEAKPDRLQIGEWRVRNDFTGKTYRQTGYTMTTFTNASGGEQVTLSGRGYRSTGYYDITTSKPLVTDADGNTLSGSFLSSGANGEAVVIDLVPGETMQATMSVGGKSVGNAPACK